MRIIVTFCSLPTSSDAPSVVSGGGFFSWGTKFKYTGRTEREILEDTGSLTREEPSIQRTSSLRRKASSVPATPSTPLQPHLGKTKHILYLVIPTTLVVAVIKLIVFFFK